MHATRANFRKLAAGLSRHRPHHVPVAAVATALERDDRCARVSGRCPPGRRDRALVGRGDDSIVAMLAFNFFFLPPVGAFVIADPQNWVALFAFLAVSLVASNLSAVARDRTQEAMTRRDELGEAPRFEPRCAADHGQRDGEFVARRIHRTPLRSGLRGDLSAARHRMDRV